MNSFYSVQELESIGFQSVGENVLISKKASIYGADHMIIGNNVRVDDFCILSGKIVLGNYIHIAPGCLFFGGEAGIEIKDFSTTSSRCAIYAISDDYSGNALTNPMLPDAYRNVETKSVCLGKHTIIGTGSTILPGCVLEDGTAVGSMSLVNKSLKGWGIYAGIPCKRIKDRAKEVLKLEKKFLESK